MKFDTKDFVDLGPNPVRTRGFNDGLEQAALMAEVYAMRGSRAICKLIKDIRSAKLTDPNARGAK